MVNNTICKHLNVKNVIKINIRFLKILFNIFQLIKNVYNVLRILNALQIYQINKEYFRLMDIGHGNQIRLKFYHVKILIKRHVKAHIHNWKFNNKKNVV